MLKMKMYLVGVSIILSLISSIYGNNIQLISVNTKKDGKWILKNYDLLLENSNRYPLGVFFYENLNIEVSINGTYTCVSAPHQFDNFYCDFFYSMFCVTQAVYEYPEFLKCYFTIESNQDDKLAVIQDCLPSDSLGPYESCKTDESQYYDRLEEGYNMLNLFELAHYGLNQSLIITDNDDDLLQIATERVNMKAYMNLEAFLNDKDLPEDSETYTQIECDNKFEVENVVRSCKLDKPLLEIFFEADDPNNIDIFSDNLLKDVREYGISNLVKEVNFVPYGNTKANDDGTYSCDNVDRCHANALFGCLAWEGNYGQNVSPFLFEMFNCISSSPNKSITAFQECLDIYFPNTSKELYSVFLDCAKQPNVLKDYKELTELRKVQSFPQVYINKESFPLKKGDNIFQKVCDTFTGIRPRLCGSVGKADPNNVLEIYYNPGKTESIAQVNTLLERLLQGSNDAFRLRHYLDIQFVPWGQTKKNPNQTIDCSESDDNQQCQVGRLLACVQKIAPKHSEIPCFGKNGFTTFLRCFYNQTKFIDQPLLSAVDCLDELSPSDFYPFITQCFRQDSKVSFWYEAAVKTQQIIGSNFEKPIYIRYQETFLDNVQDIYDVACKQNFSPKPADCPEIQSDGSSSAVTLVSSLLSLIVCTFVIVFY